MKGKCFMLGVAVAAVSRSICFAGPYSSEKVIDSESGQETALIFDTSNPKNSFLLRFTKNTKDTKKANIPYWCKVEKNDPSPKDKAENMNARVSLGDAVAGATQSLR